MLTLSLTDRSQKWKIIPVLGIEDLSFKKSKGLFSACTRELAEENATFKNTVLELDLELEAQG